MFMTANTRLIFVGAALTATLTAGPAFASEGPAASAPIATASAASPPEFGPDAAAFRLDPRPAADAMPRWYDQRRKLRIQLGVSAGFTAAFLLAGVLAMTIQTCTPPPGTDDYCGIPVARLLAVGTLFPAAAVSAIPTTVFSVRLARHNRARPVALQVAPGGLALRF